MSNNKLQHFYHLMLGTLLLIPHLAGAQTKTTYRISASGTTVKTEIKNDNSKDNLMKSFLLPTIRKTLLSNPYIASIEFTAGEVKNESNEYADYNTKSRTSFVFVNLSLPAKISMLFKVEEEFRVCKAPGQKKTSSSGGRHGYDDDYSSSDTGDCQLRSVAKVNGPLTVYGVFTSAENVEALLRDKQKMSFELSKSYDKKDSIIETEFSIESNQFERNLMKFFKIFNVQTQDKLDQVISRQALLVGISRIARQTNEGLLK